MCVLVRGAGKVKGRGEGSVSVCLWGSWESWERRRVCEGGLGIGWG